MATKYMIVDGDGNQLGGISTSEDEILRIAQSTANNLGRPVWYQGDDYEVDHRGDPIDGTGTEVEVEPESYADADEALAEIEAEEQAAHDDAEVERLAGEAMEEAEVERHLAEEREDAVRLTAALKGVGVDR